MCNIFRSFRGQRLVLWWCGRVSKYKRSPNVLSTLCNYLQEWENLDFKRMFRTSLPSSRNVWSWFWERNGSMCFAFTFELFTVALIIHGFFLIMKEWWSLNIDWLFSNRSHRRGASFVWQIQPEPMRLNVRSSTSASFQFEVDHSFSPFDKIKTM